MLKYTILCYKDDRAGIYYNPQGLRFLPSTIELANSLVTDNETIVEYDDDYTAVATMMEEIVPDEDEVAIEVNCFLITRTFKNREEVMKQRLAEETIKIMAHKAALSTL